MLRTTLVVVLGAAIGVVAGSSAAAAPPCTPSTKKVAGGVHRVLCKARVTLTVNGKRYVLQNGRCDLYPRYVTVQAGVLARGSSYFALVVGKSPVATASDPVVSTDGSYTQGAIVISVRTVSDVLLNEDGARFVLKRGRRAGTFSATDPANKRFKRPAVRVSGSFSCGGR